VGVGFCGGGGGAVGAPGLAGMIRTRGGSVVPAVLVAVPPGVATGFIATLFASGRWLLLLLSMSMMSMVRMAKTSEREKEKDCVLCALVCVAVGAVHFLNIQISRPKCPIAVCPFVQLYLLSYQYQASAI
jgi:uncharacterized membrane protein YjjP (DUF1212 family)